MKLMKASKPLSGSLEVPGDKSVSHRAVIFGSLAEGTTTVRHFLTGEDCLRTIQAFRELGVVIEQEDTKVTIHGKGINALEEPVNPIYFGNSGTTARLLLGVFAALPFHLVAYGDASLTKRPMDRVVNPLTEMGAQIDGRENGKYLPLAIRGSKLTGIKYHTPVKSAQVKSGLLLAGLLAVGETTISESAITRDHTERMLESFGAVWKREGTAVTLQGGQALKAADIYVPGDISSAAFFMVGAAIVPGSKVLLKNVGINETRSGIIDVMKDMGAAITITETTAAPGEPIADLEISFAPLKAIEISGDMIPRLIDELPILALLATQAEGTTVIKDAEELRYKETDRIQAITDTLRAFGANVEPTEDGLIIEGGQSLQSAAADSFGDHRIGMMIAIASLVTEGETELTDAEAINISYPAFFQDLQSLLG